MKVLLAHPGTQHAPELARELDRRGLLGEFRTCLALREHGLLSRLISLAGTIPVARLLRNRVIHGVNGKRIHTAPWHELRALYQLQCGRNPEEVFYERNRRFQEDIAEPSMRSADAIIGFDTSSWVLAEKAKEFGKPFWLERTINHPLLWHRDQVALSKKYPDWQESPKPRLPDLLLAEDKEHNLAYRVVVGSNFVAKTLQKMGVDSKKIVVNSYGVAWEKFDQCKMGGEPPVTSHRPVRFLFAGTVGARKGVPVLLEAWERLGWRKDQAELWLVGKVPDNQRRLIPDKDGIKVLGRVAKAEMANIYRACDIVILPSFSEGFPLVLLEALASGLPVITTPNTGAADLRDAGAADCISLVEAGSTDELQVALKQWQCDPPQREFVRAACAGLRSKFSWESYGKRWETLLTAQTK